ncbi:hypothetical protein MBLNU457_1587t1 [Dothideomycetes sp. NU457]
MAPTPTITRSGRVSRLPVRYRTGITLHGVTTNTIHACRRRMQRARQNNLSAEMARIFLGEETLGIIREGLGDRASEAPDEGAQHVAIDQVVAEDGTFIKQDPDDEVRHMANEEVVAYDGRFIKQEPEEEPQHVAAPELFAYDGTLIKQEEEDTSVWDVVVKREGSVEEGARILLMAAE